MKTNGDTVVKSMRSSIYSFDASQKPIRGFTLIELMIVVAVVAILAAVAYPSYQEQIRKSRRGQAKADMVELAQVAERYHTANNTYAGFEPTLTAGQRRSPRELATPARYTVAIAPTTQAAFTITAVPVGAQATDRCGTLTVNQAGQKTRSGTAEFNECW